MPASLDSERLLLACCLLDGPSVIPKAISRHVRPDSFYDPKHSAIFTSLLDLYATNRPTTIDVLAEELRDRRTLDSLGGYPFLVQISSRCPTTAEAETFLESVRTQALLRAIIRSRTSSVEDCYGFSGDIDQFVAELSAKESAVTQNGIVMDEEPVQSVAKELLADLGLPKAERRGVTGLVSWGVKDIDARCGMMAPGDIVILAAAPSAGKSAAALWASWLVAASGKHAIYFSYEMKKWKLIIRIAQQVSRLNYRDYDNAPMDKKMAFNAAVQAVQNCPTFHVFENETSVMRVMARASAIARSPTPVGLIVIDYMQELSELEPSIGKERTDEKLSRMAAQFRRMAKECNCPVMILSSLNRDGYRNASVRPTLSTLRNSGGLEFKGDVIAFLHWPPENPHTGQKQDVTDDSLPSVYVEFLQSKGRDNGVAMTPLMFSRPATKFDSLAR